MCSRHLVFTWHEYSTDHLTGRWSVACTCKQTPTKSRSSQTMLRQPAAYTLCFKKPGPLRQVGINSSKLVCPKWLFTHCIQSFSCGFIVLEKFSMGRVPAARFPWQQEHASRRQLHVNKQNDFAERGHWPVKEMTQSLRQGQRTTFWTFTITLRVDYSYHLFRY